MYSKVQIPIVKRVWRKISTIVIRERKVWSREYGRKETLLS